LERYKFKLKMEEVKKIEKEDEYILNFEVFIGFMFLLENLTEKKENLKIFFEP